MKRNDLLTQDGTDKYVAEEVDDIFGLVTVQCVKESCVTAPGWPLYKLGERFDELQRRFYVINTACSLTKGESNG